MGDYTDPFCSDYDETLGNNEEPQYSEEPDSKESYSEELYYEDAQYEEDSQPIEPGKWEPYVAPIQDYEQSWMQDLEKDKAPIKKKSPIKLLLTLVLIAGVVFAAYRMGLVQRIFEKVQSNNSDYVTVDKSNTSAGDVVVIDTKEGESNLEVVAEEDLGKISLPLGMQKANAAELLSIEGIDNSMAYKANGLQVGMFSLNSTDMDEVIKKIKTKLLKSHEEGTISVSNTYVGSASLSAVELTALGSTCYSAYVFIGNDKNVHVIVCDYTESNLNSVNTVLSSYYE